MKFKEGLLGFSSSSYCDKISAREYSYAELAKNIYKKRRAINVAKTSAVSSAAAAHVTGGTSLLGTGWSMRTVSVEKQKLGLLEEEWERRGQDPLPKRKLKDLWIPVIITGAIGAFTFSVDLAISNATQTAAEAAAMGIPGYEFNGHLVGAWYSAVEKGMGKAGDTINSLPYVANEIWDSPVEPDVASDRYKGKSEYREYENSDDEDDDDKGSDGGKSDSDEESEDEDNESGNEKYRYRSNSDEEEEGSDRDKSNDEDDHNSSDSDSDNHSDSRRSYNSDSNRNNSGSGSDDDDGDDSDEDSGRRWRRV